MPEEEHSETIDSPWSADTVVFVSRFRCDWIASSIPANRYAPTCNWHPLPDLASPVVRRSPRKPAHILTLLYSGVGLDLLGRGFSQFPSDLRDEILARYPRKHFKERFLQAYFERFAHKPGTAIGTVNAGVCERFIPGNQTPNACDLIPASPFPDSA